MEKLQHIATHLTAIGYTPVMEDDRCWISYAQDTIEFVYNSDDRVSVFAVVNCIAASLPYTLPLNALRGQILKALDKATAEVNALTKRLIEFNIQYKKAMETARAYVTAYGGDILEENSIIHVRDTTFIDGRFEVSHVGYIFRPDQHGISGTKIEYALMALHAPKSWN